jgi:hypothetical protein
MMLTFPTIHSQTNPMTILRDADIWKLETHPPTTKEGEKRTRRQR